MIEAIVRNYLETLYSLCHLSIQAANVFATYTTAPKLKKKKLVTIPPTNGQRREG
jgi:hypothetical protein